MSQNTNEEVPYKILNDFRQHSLIIHASNYAGAGENGAKAFGTSLQQALQAIEAHYAEKTVEARIAELETLMAKHTRTYTQTITDSNGDVYLNDSHGYISKYETQERIAELKSQKVGEV